MKTLLFLDAWFLEHLDNAELCPGVAQWRPEATYEDPYLDNQFAWTTVDHDPASGSWRMFYTGSIRPLTVMGAESDDGVHWRAMNRLEIDPGGPKFSPNHLFTVPAADGGPIYVDPTAAGDARFKLFCTQYDEPASERARNNPRHRFHELVKAEGWKPYVGEQLVGVSNDGLRWRIAEETTWGRPSQHPPDSPMAAFYSTHAGRHVMILRPRNNDRRLAIQTSADAVTWTERQLMMQPDPLDPPQVQFYGMPVVPYHGYYLGLLEIFHNSSSIRTRSLNEMNGTVDCQLAYSFNGLYFQRGFRTPFIGLNEPGQPGSAMVYPTAMVATETELRF